MTNKGKAMEHSSMTTQERSIRCMLRHWVQLDQGYDLEFPIEELGHAIALCGWTSAEHVKPLSRYDAEEIQLELARLQSLDALDIPDGRRWFRRFGKPISEVATA